MEGDLRQRIQKYAYGARLVCAILLSYAISSSAEDNSPKQTAPLRKKIWVFKIPRNKVSSDGMVAIQKNGKRQIVRLPAAVQFRKNNTFEIQGDLIHIKHLSLSAKDPKFELGKRKRFFKYYPLNVQERELLEYAGLDLFPVPEEIAYQKALDLWVEDLDSFFKLRHNDTNVIRLVQSYVLNYTNNPPDGYLTGDHLWDEPRKVQTWNQFFEYPLFYDLNGRALLVDGKPLTKGPLMISKDEVVSSERLYRKVFRSLQYSYEGYKTLLEEGNFPQKDAALAEVSCARRSYLTLKFFMMGELMWQRLNAGSK